MPEGPNSRRPSSDRVGALISLAGEWRLVPPDRAERVRAAAWIEWRREVAQRSRRRFILGSASLLTAASVALGFVVHLTGVRNGVPVPEISVVVDALVGSARIRLATDEEHPPPRELEVGDDVRDLSEMVTAKQSRATIRLTSGHSVRLDASTAIRMLGGHSLALDRGAIYVDSGMETPTSALDIHTALGVVQEVGTQFEVRVGVDSVRVRLREGAVVVHGRRRSHTLEAGGELRLRADGSVARGPIATYGPDWEWIVAVTPVPNLEGRTALEFLEWVTRERGWTLNFATDDVARFAGEIVLGGTFDRLTLADALDAVLPACRMDYEVEDGVLRIEEASREHGVS